MTIVDESCALDTITAEQVAKTVEGIAVIGHACVALRDQGWQVNLVANRLTVNNEVLAQLLPPRIGDYGVIEATWVVRQANGLPPVWVVGGGVA